MLPVVGELRPWADPGITSIRRLPSRPPTVAYADVDEARSDDRHRSPWWTSLDGRWRFRWYADVDRVPPNAVRPPDSSAGPRSVEGWTTAVVPGNWTMQPAGQDGGDLPWYTNVTMPFDGPPPRLPERIPTGVYQRSVNVPRRWRDRRIVLGIGGAESVHVVYVNGHFAGYGTDSRLTSEYDVTDHLQPGRNHLTIVVLRWSAHSYVEDQDQWWMAGLHREVTLEARAPVGVASVVCDAGYAWDAPQPHGTVTVRTSVGSASAPGPGWSVRTTVETMGGRRLAAERTSAVPHRFDRPYVFTGHDVVETFEVPGARPWSAERPDLARVLVELMDPDGRVTEVHTQRVGFRDVAVRDGRFCVNGVPVLVFGVNRHDHHPERGTAVTVDDVRDDLLAMKRLGVNAIRCSHYPNDPRLLDLCDELGFYVVDEANLESHAYNTSLCDDPRYRAAWVERGARMVQRDRNHPSVVMWSLGNESGAGTNHEAQAAWIRSADPSRPLHYEGAVFHSGWQAGHSLTDVVCPMYPPLDAVVAYRGDRPLILCEYSHAMGNSNGGLADVWDAVDASFRAGGPLQGGFVWEWKDHGLLADLPNGRRGFAYGGMFGEPVHDGNFVADGIVASDGTSHPAVHELAWVHRPVAVRDGTRPDTVRVWNRRSFTDLADLRGEWSVLVDGHVRSRGRFDPGPVEPLAEVEVPLPEEAFAAIADVDEAGADPRPEVVVRFRWRTRRATAWAPAGSAVAHDEVIRTVARRRAAGTDGGDHGRDRRDRVPVAHGLVGSVELCLRRAPTDNDGFKLMPDLHERLGVGGGALARWTAAGVFDVPADGLVDHRHVVTVLADGGEFHEHEVVVPDHLADLPRVGVRFLLDRTGPEGVDPDRAVVRWYGRGPHENYPDRNRAALLGVGEAPLDHSPYLVPQEHGLRTDCRWFQVVDQETGAGVRVEAVRPGSLHVAALRVPIEVLHDAAHETDLDRSGPHPISVHVDVAHRGLGTASCGPDVDHRYRIAPGTYRFGYVLRRVRR